MIITPNKQNITIPSKMYFVPSWQETGEDFTGLDIRFEMVKDQDYDDVVMEKDQSDMIISGDTITMPMTTQDTDLLGLHWYELWVEWQPDQWVPEFEGQFTFTPSVDYLTKNMV